MEDEARQAFFRELIRDPSETIARQYPEQVKKYETAGRVGRWFIRRHYPDVADRYDYLQAQQSVVDARRAAAADPFNDVPLGAA